MIQLVLASTSAARRALLTAAAVPHDAVPPRVDEAAVKAGMAGASPRDLADALAELKAVRVSQKLAGVLVLGCDQVASTDDGEILDKPASREDAAGQLRRLRGRRHTLTSAAVIAENGRAVWRAADVATLEMREFSEEFLDSYLDGEWPEIGGCVGGYRLEAAGIQLFARVRGDHFTILGLPMLPLLDYLRERGVIKK